MFKRAHLFRLFRYGCLLAGLCLAYGFFVEPKFSRFGTSQLLLKIGTAHP